MSRTTTESKAHVMTFRIDPALKADLSELARQESKPVGELLRELVRERVERQRRREFGAEAHGQSLEIAAAHDPNSDETTMLRELEGLFDDLTASEDEEWGTPTW